MRSGPLTPLTPKVTRVLSRSEYNPFVFHLDTYLHPIYVYFIAHSYLYLIYSYFYFSVIFIGLLIFTIVMISHVPVIVIFIV